MKNYQNLKKLRLEKERKCGHGVFDKKNNTLYIENIPYIFKFFTKILKYSGIYDLLYKNALDVLIKHETWSFHNLPADFNEFKILQISDLHIDSLPELSEILPPVIAAANADLVVFTGDFRFVIHCSNVKISELLKPIIIEANKAEFGSIAVLGNHDYLQYTIDNVASHGVNLLLNESYQITKNNSSISLIGIDDPHYYKTGRIFDFRDTIKNSEFNILLAHSPEIYNQAALYNIDLYLCGHTHGGQICLPGGFPILTNSRTSRKFVQGRWKHKNLQGYTSCGTGASGLPIRWNCPPEITVHKLVKEK